MEKPKPDRGLTERDARGKSGKKSVFKEKGATGMSLQDMGKISQLRLREIFDRTAFPHTSGTAEKTRHRRNHLYLFFSSSAQR